MMALIWERKEGHLSSKMTCQKYLKKLQFIRQALKEGKTFGINRSMKDIAIS